MSTANSLGCLRSANNARQTTLALIDNYFRTQESRLLSREIAVRRFARNRLYTGGKILHIVRRKKTELEKYVEP